MARRIMMVLGLMVLGSGVVMAVSSTDTVHVNLLVTPVVNVDLNIDTTYYNFGNVDVADSTASISALTLSNNGDTGIRVDKAVWLDDEWFLSDDTTETNGFDLWAMTNTSTPGTGDYSGTQQFNDTLESFNSLTDSSDVSIYMNPNTSRDLWFRLDMPADVANGNQQTITVRLKAIGQ